MHVRRWSVGELATAVTGVRLERARSRSRRRWRSTAALVLDVAQELQELGLDPTRRGGLLADRGGGHLDQRTA